MNIAYKTICIFFILQVGEVSLAQSPERRIQESLGELEEILVSVQSLEPLNANQGLSPINEEALVALEKGKSNYKKREYQAVIRNLNFYLNSTQRAKTSDYLLAQYLLGSSYQYLGRTRSSIRAYNRYLGSFISSDDKADINFINAVQNILVLSSELSRREKSKVYKLMSSLASIELPKKESSRVAFYLAMTAKHEDKAYLAEQLFEKSKNSSSDHLLVAENIYFSALIAFKNRNYKTAKKRFRAVLTETPKNKYHSYSYLNLARLEAMQGNMEGSLSLYNRVSGEIYAYEHAIYESIFVQYKRRNYDEALVLARKYLDSFRNPDRIEQAKHMEAYLKTKTGDVKGAQASLHNRTKVIENFENWMIEKFHDVDRITHQNLIEIQDRGRVVSKPSKSFRDAEQVFTRIDALLLRLSDIRSELRSTIYQMGQEYPETYNPMWLRRSKQIEEKVLKVFDQGDKLLKLEFDLFTPRFSESLKIKLIRSRQRRLQVKERFAKELYHQGRWQSWVTLTKFNIKLDKIYRQLLGDLAETRGMAFINKDNRHIDLLNNMLDRGERLLSSTNRAVEIVRSRSIRDIANQSHHAAVHKFILDYSQASYEESVLLRKIREKFDSPSVQHMSQDLVNAWQKWDFLVKTLYRSNRKLDKEIKQHLQSILSEMDQKISQYESQKQALLSHRKDLEKSLATNIQNLLSHYQNSIKEKRSQLLKWEADNQWTAYSQKIERQEKEENVFQRRKAQMEEDLFDLEYEVMR